MVKLEENNIYFYFNKDKLIENFNDFSELGNIYYPLKTNSIAMDNEYVNKSWWTIYKRNKWTHK